MNSPLASRSIFEFRAPRMLSKYKSKSLSFMGQCSSAIFCSDLQGTLQRDGSKENRGLKIYAAWSLDKFWHEDPRRKVTVRDGVEGCRLLQRMLNFSYYGAGLPTGRV